MPTRRAAAIEYAIRDVVVPALELEKMGHEIIKMNIGDPLAYPGLPTPSHMVEAFKQALDQDNGYGPSYGIPALREAIAADEKMKRMGMQGSRCLRHAWSNGSTPDSLRSVSSQRRFDSRSRAPLSAVSCLSSNVWR